jgi:hypothetical protein
MEDFTMWLFLSKEKDFRVLLCVCLQGSKFRCFMIRGKWCFKDMWFIVLLLSFSPNGDLSYHSYMTCAMLAMMFKMYSCMF